MSSERLKDAERGFYENIGPQLPQILAQQSRETVPFISDKTWWGQISIEMWSKMVKLYYSAKFMPTRPPGNKIYFQL